LACSGPNGADVGGAEARAQAALQGGELPFFMASDVWLMVLGFGKHDQHML
jgi:hypothetical protein